jgi:AcrR family transcriptional regulator
MAATASTTRTPRRRTSGKTTKSQIARALLDLINEGHLQPNHQAIAERAGVSRRTVFVHFDDKEELYAEVIRQQVPRVERLIQPIARTAPLERRVAALVAQRDHLYSTIANLRRAVRSEPSARNSPKIAVAAERLRRVFDQQVRTTFAYELRRFKKPAAALQRIELATSFETWHHLVSHQRLSRDQVRANMAILVWREVNVSVRADDAMQ